MSSRMNGYLSERENRPPSEQMADLHVYIVPPDIWREKYHNALNQNINETVSIGFIRVHPETKIYALRDEIEQQLGTELVPQEYVFVKSVGRSLTRLKARQEAQLKVKNFLPPQAYAPELYLLEATPEVRQQIAASSEGSTRPATRTSYDYDYARQSDENFQLAKHSHGSNGGVLNPSYRPLPDITPRNNYSGDRGTPPAVTMTEATPRTVQPISQNGYNTQSGVSNQQQQLQYDRPPLTDRTPRNNPNSDKTYQRINPTNQLNKDDVSRSDPRHSHPSYNSAPNPDASHRGGAGSQQQSGPHEDGYLQPLSATPPHTDSEKDKHSHRHGHHGNSNHGNSGNQHKHDGDSGIAGFTPETYRENDPLDRRKGNSDQNDRLKAPSPDEAGPLNRSQDGNDSDWERRRQEEQERARKEEEERLRQEEEDKRREEQDREDIAEQAKMMRTNSDEDLKHYPSPPPLRLASPERDSESARARRQKEKEELLKELERAKEARKASERQREELVKHAKQMQTKTQNKRNHARDLWKKRYFEEKKKTTPLEEQCNRLRHELDIIHKKLLSTLEGPKEKATKLNDLKPNNKVGSPGRPLNNFKIQATRLQHEIEDIRRRVDHAKMKLTSEMKLRNQAETELRALRAELTQKKINLTLSRNSHLTTYAPPAADVNLISARAGITPRS